MKSDGMAMNNPLRTDGEHLPYFLSTSVQATLTAMQADAYGVNHLQANPSENSGAHEPRLIQSCKKQSCLQMRSRSKGFMIFFNECF